MTYSLMRLQMKYHLLDVENAKGKLEAEKKVMVPIGLKIRLISDLGMR